MEIPPDLKYIAPFIQRGEELKERDPVIAYYAHYYAATLALRRGPGTKENNAFVSKLLDELEEWKKKIGNNEAITDDNVGYAYIENFALKVFINADNEDRAGKASKKTAKTFLAASIFLELLKVFGEIDPEVEEKIRYAKWKATDIVKAIRENRVPTPGPPGGDKQEGQENASTTSSDHLAEKPNVPFSQDMPVDPPSSISEFPSPPSNFTAPLSSTSPTTANNAPFPAGSPPPANNAAPPTVIATTPQPAPPRAPSTVPAVATAPGPVPAVAQTSYLPPASIPAAAIIDPGKIASAQKNAKWAISALNYDDIKTARLQLLAALNDIGFNQSNNFGF